ncbi:SusC/RagA family TonB-linked outer membrane protein [Halosquirtibacter xylanolyticus]|uniref:SusC/RagA family TonB-linked outer membrane protein n=1 Tax=Halosquirtibacter xylanolyticus TaxID=3374599 RepID=UPI003747E3EC|nr:SusC/RagA family TonB-linked outer membrane protein [Prolixibacteraceae bacterium]
MKSIFRNLRGITIPRKTIVYCLFAFILLGSFSTYAAPIKAATKANQEKKTISGTVIDTKGAPIPGVTVIIKGTTNGAATDFDGKFNIRYSNPQAILVVSYIGMETQELKIQGKSTIKVTLKSDAEQLDEVIVTGYQKVDRKLFAGAAAKVKMDDVQLASEADISKSLEGRVAGVSVQNVSSTFGAAPKIRVRGASSIYGNQKPLWVVDGVVLEDAVDVSMDDLNSGDMKTIISSGVAGINSDDIESFQILKDASATALYGARAMNGVIVISTKKGKDGTLNVNYSMGLTVRPIPSYNDYNILNSKDQMQVNKEIYEKGWINIANTQFAKNHGAYAKLFNEISKNNVDWSSAEDTEINNFLRKYENANTDWFDQLFQTGIQQNHTVSVSGGSEKSNFYVSLGYLNDAGWTVADNVDRYTALLKGTFRLSEKFSVTASTNLSYRNQRLPGSSQSASSDNDKTAGGVNRYTGRVERDFDLNPYIYALTTSRNIRTQDDNGNPEYFRRNYVDFNMLQELERDKTLVDVRDMSFNTTFNYNFNKRLTWNTRLSARYYTARTQMETHESSAHAAALRAGTGPNDSEIIRDDNRFLYEKPGSTTGIKYSSLPSGGLLNLYENLMTNYYVNSSVNWNPVIGDDHMFTFLAGGEFRYIDRVSNNTQGYGFNYDMGNLASPTVNFMEKLSLKGKSYYGLSKSYDRFEAFFLNYGYNYKGKYTFNGTFRYDGSNRLGVTKTARWMPTWNVSTKWNMKNENFLTDVSWLNNLAVRAGYGLNGSLGDAKNASLYLRSYNIARPLDPTQSQTGISIEGLENSDLSWEKQYELNIGAEFAIWNNRVSGDFNYYNREGYDLIGRYQSSGIGGKLFKKGNIADMDSYGYEMSLDVIPVKTKNFAWRASFSYSYHHSEIKNLVTKDWVARATSVYGVPSNGGAVRGIYSARFAGLDTKGVPTFYNRDNETVRYLKLQTADFSDFEYSGSLEPTTNLGISNSIKFKNLTVSALITGQFGHVKRVMQDFNYEYDDSSSLSEHLKNRWRVAGDETKTNIPAIQDYAFMKKADDANDIQRAYRLYGMSDYWIADASFIRLKNVSISYNLPKKWISGLGIKTCNFSVQGTNLALLWAKDSDKLNGEDPEFVWSGGTTMPITKQYSFTFKIGL